ncbi:MAG: hypothetical protein AB7O97_15235 [Planctomycetota bacterium]
MSKTVVSNPSARVRARLFPLAALALAAALPAQVQPGGAVVLGTGATLMSIVDPDGTVTTLTGFDPATQDASAVTVTRDAFVFVGLRATNTGSGASLGMRLLLVAGSVVTDLPFATLMAVPAGETWEVADLHERDDGQLLVLARQVTANPTIPGGHQVFVVSPTATVQVVPTAPIALGIPTEIADLDIDTYAIGIDQPFFVRNLQIQQVRYDGTGAPVDVAQFVAVGAIAGLRRDVSGELVFAGSTSAGSMFRIPVAPSATPVAVPGGPLSFEKADIGAAGVIAGSTFGGGRGRDLVRADTVSGATMLWVSGWTTDVVDLALAPNPRTYGRERALALPELGALGGAPQRPNPAFGLRLFDPAATPALVAFAGSILPINLPTTFGTLLVDPTPGLFTFGAVGTGGSQPSTVGVPLPNDPSLGGVAFFFQAVVLPVSGAVPFLSSAMSIVVE